MTCMHHISSFSLSVPIRVGLLGVMGTASLRSTMLIDGQGLALGVRSLSLYFLTSLIMEEPQSIQWGHHNEGLFFCYGALRAPHLNIKDIFIEGNIKEAAHSI